MKPLNHIPVYRLTLGALYIALFALAGNVPFLSAIYIIPNVPLTLQTFIIAMMGLTLGLRSGMISYVSLLVLTFCGLPMMSGGRGGPAVFVGPTCGYIYGWIFVIVLLGLYSSFFIKRLINKKVWGISIHVPISFLLGIVGILLDYACGSLGLILSGAGKTISAFPALLLSNIIAFLPGDTIKMLLASLLSLSLFAKPVQRRIFN